MPRLRGAERGDLMRTRRLVRRRPGRCGPGGSAGAGQRGIGSNNASGSVPTADIPAARRRRSGVLRRMSGAAHLEQSAPHLSAVAVMRLFELLAPGYVAIVVVGLDLIGLDLDQLVTLHVQHPEVVRVAVLLVLAVLLLLLLDPNRLGVRRR